MDMSLVQQAFELASDSRLRDGCDKKVRHAIVSFELKDSNRITLTILACCAYDAHFKAYFDLLPTLQNDGFEVSSILIKFQTK